MMNRLFGLQVRTSKYVPAEGWSEKPNATSIRRENLDTLAHGGSLIECEAPRSWGAVVFMIAGNIITHPQNAAKLIGVGGSK